MKGGVVGLAALMALSASVGIGLAQEADGVPTLTGRWQGDAIFMLPDGKIRQEHVFVFGETVDGLFAGEHLWSIPDHKLRSHDGREFTYDSSEPFQGVVSSDGDIWLVEMGDTTFFHLNFIDENTLEFLAMEGAPHSLVGRGVLVRE